jgi:chromosomal replication initiation ATPase DnaA
MVDRVFNCQTMSTTRKRKHVNGRVATSFYLRTIEKMTLESIAKAIGRNHASIIHYIKQHDSYYNYDKEYKRMYDNLINTEKPVQWLCNQCNYDGFKTITRTIPSL